MVLEQNPLVDIQNSKSVRYTVLNGRVYDARTMSRLEETGPGPKPSFFWQKWQDALPDRLEGSGCAGCGTQEARAIPSQAAYR